MTTPHHGDDWASRHLTEKVYPALYARLDVVFRDFGFRKMGSKWEATRWPDWFRPDVTSKRPSRLHVYEDRPYRMAIEGRSGEGPRLLLLHSGRERLAGADFIDAAKALSEEVGVPFPSLALTDEQRDRVRRRELRNDILETAVRLLVRNLRNTPTAVEYLMARGLSEQAIAELELGFYSHRQALRQHLHLNDFSDEDIAEAGLGGEGMVGYITFPWRDEHGHMVTMYGRWPETKPPDGLPKTTALPGEGSKSTPLYFHRFVTARERDLVLVEGVLDAAVLQALGDSRVVAMVGAQLTMGQRETIKRRPPRRVYIVGDPDGGGDAGNLANAKAIRELGIPAYIVPRLPDGMDPDEFTLAHGIDKWREHVANAMTAATFLALDAGKGVTPESPPAERREAIARFHDLMERAVGPGAAMDREDIARVAAEVTGYTAEAIAIEEDAIASSRRAERAERDTVRAIADTSSNLAKDPSRWREESQALRQRLADVGSDSSRVETYSTMAMVEKIVSLPIGLSGGFGILDSTGLNFRPGELALLAARPGHGKTSALVHLLHRWATKEEGVVVFLSWEEPGDAIFCRLVARLCFDIEPGVRWTTQAVRDCIRAGLDSVGKRYGSLDVSILREALDIHERMEDRISVVYAPHLDAEGAVGVVRDIAARRGPLLACIGDYLQKCPSPRTLRVDRRDQQVTHTARTLKMASVDLGVPFVMGCQVNRESLPDTYTAQVESAVEKGKDEDIESVVRRSRPALHQLREGGSEQEADVVLGLLSYGADIPRDKVLRDVDRFDVGGLKVRYGQNGTWAALRFDGGRSLIEERG